MTFFISNSGKNDSSDTQTGWQPSCCVPTSHIDQRFTAQAPPQEVQKTANRRHLPAPRRKNRIHLGCAKFPFRQHRHQQLCKQLGSGHLLGQKTNARAGQDSQLQCLQIISNVARLVFQHHFLSLWADQYPGAFAVVRRHGNGVEHAKACRVCGARRRVFAKCRRQRHGTTGKLPKSLFRFSGFDRCALLRAEGLVMGDAVKDAAIAAAGVELQLQVNAAASQPGEALAALAA